MKRKSQEKVLLAINCSGNTECNVFEHPNISSEQRHCAILKSTKSTSVENVLRSMGNENLLNSNFRFISRHLNLVPKTISPVIALINFEWTVILIGDDPLPV